MKKSTAFARPFRFLENGFFMRQTIIMESRNRWRYARLVGLPQIPEVIRSMARKTSSTREINQRAVSK